MNRTERTGYVIVWRNRPNYKGLDYFYSGKEEDEWLCICHNPSVATFFDQLKDAETRLEILKGHVENSHYPPQIVKVKEITEREVFLEDRWETSDLGEKDH